MQESASLLGPTPHTLYAHPTSPVPIHRSLVAFVDVVADRGSSANPARCARARPGLPRSDAFQDLGDACGLIEYLYLKEGP
jgi:hypothetical protein